VDDVDEKSAGKYDTLRRGAGYASQLLEKVSRKLKKYAENPKLFFMHIPKTGGTSVKNAFRKSGGE
jgi:hypothetical protein